ncbi:type II secretion system protein, partial [bacterium]|nr:type II secretion system protein [bacterium]
MKRLFGFTLAETLIVMGIIGVVAALTLPNLNSSTGDKEKVAKVKKIYSNLNDVMGRATVVYGDYSSWGTNVTKIAGRLTDFMKLSKDCGTSGSGCFSTNVTTDTSSSFSVLNSAFYKVILADGTSLS